MIKDDLMVGRMSSNHVRPAECDQKAPVTFSLSHERVDLWKVQLDQPETVLRLFENTLAIEESERASRFHFERDQRHFTAARAQLRMILSRYIAVDAAALVFAYGPYGKPVLATPSAPALKFNLSHSGGLALVAVTCDREVGVDIEEMRPLEDAEKVAEQFFSARENAELRALPEQMRLEAFYWCWTLKEAYVKGTGWGLGIATDSFDVAFLRGEPVRLRNVEGRPEEASRWSLVGLAPADGFAGAVAVEGHDWTLAWRELDLGGR